MDLPPVSQDFSEPLPAVDSSSDLVPYRIGSSAPGQPQQVATGYAARARPPIQPPEGFGGGVGVPNLDQVYQAAFSQLPVDEAVKAVDAATRYIGQRGYQKDLASGMNAAQAFAKWGPTLFKQATGVPEAIERSVPPPISPQQIIQNRMAQQRLELAQQTEKAKLDAAQRMTPFQTASIALRQKAMEDAASKPKPLPLEQQEELKDAYREQAEARKDLAKNAEKEVTDKPVVDAMTRLDQAQKRIAKFANPAQTQAASPFKEGQIVKNKKDGKRYKIVNGQPVELKE